jgi:peroxiredoxin
MKIVKWSILLGLMLFQISNAVAQPIVKPSAKSSVVKEAQLAIGQQVRWTGNNQSGKAIDIASLKGSVVLFFYWSTSCHVCLETMAELRENVKGWKGKPFTLVTVNVDKMRGDFENYAQITKAISGEDPQCQLIYQKDTTEDNLLRPGQLPASYVVDTKGVLRDHYFGRIPNKAWDDIADLLP